MELEFTYLSKVNEGKLVSNRKPIAEAIKHFEGKTVEVRIRKKRSIRTNRQNALWWLYMSLIEKETGTDKEELHDVCKRLFLPKIVGIPNILTGEVKQCEGMESTKKLSKMEFMELIDKVIFWANDFLGITLPLPDKQIKL